MVTAPIYQDTYYESTAEVLNYTISVGGTIIYNGRAYRLPNADAIRININKVCQNYLSNNIETLLLVNQDTSIENAYAYREFILADGNGITLETYAFLYDWSYEPWDGGNKVMSRPINGHYSAGMLKLKTSYTDDGVSTDNHSGDYPIEIKCAEYALYYLNAGGGWDAFLIEGNTLKTDNITQYTSDRSFDNNSLDFEADRYISEIVTSYEMHTGFLSDEESENFAKNLVGSNKVYIHNLKEGRIIPAVITDTTSAYRTYSNNGKKLVEYTLKIKESQSKLRR